MKLLTGWIKHHQIVSFFAIAFAITWGLGFSYGGFLQQGKYWLGPLVSIATCGPALAGILISAITNTRPRQGTRRAFWIAFAVAWVVSALVFLISITLSLQVPLSLGLIALALASALPVAFVISMAYSRLPAVRDHVSSLVRLRGVSGWAFLALVLFPALLLLSIPVSRILGEGPVPAPQLPDAGLELFALVTIRFIYQLFFFNAAGEEVGWRGFVLPRLQARASPLVAALTISFFWAPWHFFLWQAEGSPVMTWQFWIERYLSMILFSLIIVWICNRARGSILVAGIAHAAGNTASAIIPLQAKGLYLTLIVSVLVMVLLDRMWVRLPPEHPAVLQSSG